MEFGRRVAMEEDIERNFYANLGKFLLFWLIIKYAYTTYFSYSIVFDESGTFLLYGTLLGVKRKFKVTLVYY